MFDCAKHVIFPKERNATDSNVADGWRGLTGNVAEHRAMACQAVAERASGNSRRQCTHQNRECDTHHLPGPAVLTPRIERARTCPISSAAESGGGDCLSFVGRTATRFANERACKTGHLR